MRHYGHAQILQEVRVVPECDGEIQRICKIFARTSVWEVDTIKKSINELQGRRPSRDEQSYEKSRTITFGKFPDDTKSERIIETIETMLKDSMHDIEDDGIFAYGKKFATMGAARFKTEEAMWKYLKKDSKSKCMKIDDFVLYVNRAEQGTSDDHARTKAVRKLVRTIIEKEDDDAHTKNQNRYQKFEWADEAHVHGAKIGENSKNSKNSTTLQS